MKISDIGEDGFIERVKTLFPTHPPFLGIGDDSCVIPIENSDEAYLVSTDALIEGTHFLPTTSTPYSLGYKSASVNLSDIAAMGGEPLYAFLTLGVPKTTEIQDLDEFLRGFKEALFEANVKLLGGDTVLSPHKYINVTVMGKANISSIKLRRAACFNDLVCVDGTLGDSSAGLEILLKRKDLLDKAQYSSLIRAHQMPKAHTTPGLWLGKSPNVHAMMDLSDGLATDLPRLLRASHCGASIDLEKLPISDACRAFSEEIKGNLFNFCVGGGEDYCLLFTLAKEHFNELNTNFQKKFGHPLYPIGEITQKTGKIEYFSQGQVLDLLPFSTFKHF